MTADDVMMDAEERMEKALGVLKKALAGIRTGRANPGLVDSLRVDVYGSTTPIKALASVSAPESTQILVRPFDPNTIKEIEKAILASDLGLNPQNDGKLIRVPVPPLSTEVRRKMVARVRELAEEAKVAVRNIRRDGNKAVDQGFKDKEFSEDQRDQLKEQIQELTKEYENQANDAAKHREQEVMEE
jgi:ribosome recycling factor